MKNKRIKQIQRGVSKFKNYDQSSEFFKYVYFKLKRLYLLIFFDLKIN